MKLFKIIIFIFSVLIIFPLAGCQNKNIVSVTETPTATKTDETVKDNNKLFELKLYSDKTTYITADKIKIWATLKYIGTNSHITIWHGDPYISFTISDGKDFNTGGLFDDVLSSTELEKDKIYKFEYSKNGGYSADDPKADFWKKFYSEKYLNLPEGEYTIKVGTAFSLTKDLDKSRCDLSEELKIVVKSSSKDDEINTAKSKKLALDVNEIQQINISSSLPLFQSFDIKDNEQISSVVDYLTELNSNDTEKNPKDYFGMGYGIKIQFKNGLERTFSLIGNMFFMESGGFTYEIPYVEACKFDTLAANILEKNQTNDGIPFIEGKIISVESENSGRNTSFVLQDNKKSKYFIDLKDANIIDSTGNGWMILHTEDDVKVFYDNSKSSGDNSIMASTVYIKKSPE